MRHLFTKLAIVASLACFVIAISGCNTIEGAGQDLESGGEAIQDAAD